MTRLIVNQWSDGHEQSHTHTHTRDLFVAGLLVLVKTVAPAIGKESPDTNQPTDLFSMPLEQLMALEVTSTATLTKTKANLVPAAMTTITQEQIRSSGARSLYELLDIYVPNFQIVFHSAKLEGIWGQPLT